MRDSLTRPTTSNHTRIQQIIDDLRKAEFVEVMRDQRSAGRIPFVRPVLITLGRNGDTDIHAISNNMSHVGIGLILDTDLTVGRIGVLTIHRLHDPPVRFRSELRWCQPFCGSWFSSGWHFIAEE